MTSDLGLPVLQEVFDLSRQTLELLLEICLHGSLQLERKDEKGLIQMYHEHLSVSLIQR